MRSYLPVSKLRASLSTGCDRDEDTSQTQGGPSTDSANATAAIPFEGQWAREFEAGPGNLHTVLHATGQDSMRYPLGGPSGPADYAMLRDNSVRENNRYPGHTPNGLRYLAFAREHAGDSISFCNLPVDNLEEGMTVAAPPASTTVNRNQPKEKQLSQF